MAVASTISWPAGPSLAPPQVGNSPTPRHLALALSCPLITPILLKTPQLSFRFGARGKRDEHHET